jgi:hypothetical protein
MVASAMRDEGKVAKRDTLALPVSERARKVQTLFKPSRGGWVVPKSHLRVAEIVKSSCFPASVTERPMQVQALLAKMVSRRRVALFPADHGEQRECVSLGSAVAAGPRRRENCIRSDLRTRVIALAHQRPPPMTVSA